MMHSHLKWVCWKTVTLAWDFLLDKCHFGVTHPGWGPLFSGFCFFFFSASHPHFAVDLPQGACSGRVQRRYRLFENLHVRKRLHFDLTLDSLACCGILGTKSFHKKCEDIVPLAFSFQCCWWKICCQSVYFLSLFSSGNYDDLILFSLWALLMIFLYPSYSKISQDCVSV